MTLTVTFPFSKLPHLLSIEPGKETFDPFFSPGITATFGRYRVVRPERVRELMPPIWTGVLELSKLRKSFASLVNYYSRHASRSRLFSGIGRKEKSGMGEESVPSPLAFFCPLLLTVEPVHCVRLGNLQITEECPSFVSLSRPHCFSLQDLAPANPVLINLKKWPPFKKNTEQSTRNSLLCLHTYLGLSMTLEPQQK